MLNPCFSRKHVKPLRRITKKLHGILPVHKKVTEKVTETLTVIIDSLYEHERIPVLDFWDCGIYTEITVRTGLQSVTVHSVPSDTLCGTLPVNSNNKASEKVNRFTANVSNNCT